MDIKTYFQKQMTRVWSQIDAAVNDTTDEQFNWPPLGTIRIGTWYGRIKGGVAGVRVR